MGWNTDDLVAAVKREAYLPDFSDQSDADLLAFADDELDTLIAQVIRPGREGHWLASEDVTIVPGTTTYTVPRRCLGRTVRAVMAVQPNGQEFPLEPSDPIELRTMFSPGSTFQPRFYAFEAETIRLGSVAPETGWKLRILYLRQPPKLVPMANALTVLTCPSATQIKAAEVAYPTGMADQTLVDVVAGVEPYVTLYQDQLATNFNTGTSMLTVTSGAVPIDPTRVAPFQLGRQPDVVCVAETTVYPPIPRTLWSTLVRSTASAALAAVRDPGAEEMMARAVLARKAAIAVMNPRDDRRSKPILGMSTLRAFTRRRRW